MSKGIEAVPRTCAAPLREVGTRTDLRANPLFLDLRLSTLVASVTISPPTYKSNYRAYSCYDSAQRSSAPRIHKVRQLLLCGLVCCKLCIHLCNRQLEQACTAQLARVQLACHRQCDTPVTTSTARQSLRSSRGMDSTRTARRHVQTRPARCGRVLPHPTGTYGSLQRKNRA